MHSTCCSGQRCGLPSAISHVFRAVCLVCLVLVPFKAFAATKALIVEKVKAPPTAQGSVVDYAILNRQMTGLKAIIDMTKGHLVVTFRYPSQAWILNYGDKDGVIRSRDPESEYEYYFEHPQRFLITLSDQYGQRVTQFQTGTYWIPQKVLQTIRKYPRLNPSSTTPIQEYDGAVLQVTVNTLRYQLNANMIGLVRKVAVCFNTNKVIKTTQLRKPPYLNQKEKSWASIDPAKEKEERMLAAMRTEGTQTITVDGVALECAKRGDGAGHYAVVDGKHVVHGPFDGSLPRVLHTYNRVKCTFKKGVLHGHYIEYESDNCKVAECDFKDGVRDGRYVRYERCKPIEEYLYRNGKRTYMPNSVITPSEEITVDGLTLRCRKVPNKFDKGYSYIAVCPDTDCRKEMVEHGPYVSFYKRTDKKTEEGTFKKGKRFGRCVKYHLNGQKSEETLYDAGGIRRQTVWDESGQVQRDMVWEDGKPRRLQ